MISGKMENTAQGAQNPSISYLNNINKPPIQASKQYVLGDVDETANQERRYACRVYLIEKQWKNFTLKTY